MYGDELKVPYVSLTLLDYLEKVYNPNNLLDIMNTNSDMTIGYLKGCRDVISHLKAIRESKGDGDNVLENA